MSELTLLILRLALLAGLWLLIFIVLGVVRRDIYGTNISRRARRRQAEQSERLAQSLRAQPASPVPAGGAVPEHTQPAPPPPSANPPQGRFRRRQHAPATLDVTAGKLAGTSVPLKSSGVLIGRNPECTLVLDDDFASGRHCRVYIQGDQWFVEDLGSTNGTVVGGEKISTPTPLAAGSQLKIGKTVIEVRG